MTTDSTGPTRPIAIFGEVLFDCFPDGRRILGGAPFNVAWHLCAFGGAPLLISAVGEDAPGAAVRAAMAGWGMDQRALQTDPSHPTGEVLVRFIDGEPDYTIVAARAFDHVRPELLDPPPWLLYHGTLGMRAPVSAGALAALKAASPGLRCVDVNLRAPWWCADDVRALLAGADWVKLNRDELLLLADPNTGPLDPQDDGALAALATAFCRRHGLGTLVVTLGAAGVLAVSATSAPLRLPAPTVTVLRDTVGAGDAFAAVLILGLSLDWPLAMMLNRALKFAARICAQPGATAADRDLYRPFLAEWGIAGP